MAKASPLVILRGIVTTDPVAIRGWSTVVDHIVRSEPYKRRIRDLLREGEINEAILQSLEVWFSGGGQIDGLLAVLKDQHLHALVERIQEPKYTSVFQELRSERRTESGSTDWHGVGHVVVNCTGREHEIETAHTRLAESHSREAVVTVTISGLGGIGKSTLARKYAFTHRDFYEGNVLWINAETVDSMRASFVRLAKGLGLQLEDQPPQQLLVEKVFEQFQKRKCLFIFDNVENLAEFKQFRPKIMNPSHEVPYVLVTSRLTDLNALPANEIRLDVLTPEEAVELIQKQLPRATSANAVKLADKQQRLPLALQQAVAYIRGTYVDDDDKAILEYLMEFEKSEAKLLNDERFREHNDYSSTTFATWQTTLTRIREMGDGELAIRVITALAYLNPDLISLKFLKAIFEEAETRCGLKLLERFSMISVTDGKVSIHRLVQHVVRLSFGERAEDEIQTLVTAIARQFVKDGYKLNDINRECTSHGLHLFPFQMTHRHSAAMTTNLAYFADFCYSLMLYGNYAECLSISQQMASLYESVHGEKHVTTIRMKWKMADAYSCLGKFADSLQILNSILPTAKSALGTEHVLTVSIQAKLAFDLSQTGDNEKALQIYHDILPFAESVYGENDNNVLFYKTNKAVALRRLGKLDEALELLQHVDEKQVSLHGENDVRTLRAKSQIAFVHYDKKEFSRALQMWEEVETVWRLALGDTHPNTVQVRNNIADCKAQLAKRKRRKCKML